MKSPSPIHEILVLHHSHTDIGFTHPPTIIWELNRRFIDEALDLCESSADWAEPSRVRWTCETTAPLIHWLERAPARQIERFRRLVRQGQIGAAAMGLNITPLFNAEELIRHLEPIGLLRKELGLPLKVAINHDVNGLPWPITDLLLDAGVEMLMMGINLHTGGCPLPRPRGFWWKSPAGRRLLAFNAPHYQGFDREARIRENSIHAMADGLAACLEHLQSEGYPYDFVYLSATHHAFPDNNPPNPRTARLIRQWNREGREPRIRYVLPEELAENLARQPAAHLPERAGDWTDFWNFGCASAAAETKVNRHARHRLNVAETLRSLADVPTPKLLDSVWAEAWRCLQVYDEHTWGSFAMLRSTPIEPVNEVWYQKAFTTYQARSLASLAFRDVLEQWAGPAAADEKPSGIMLYNPSGTALTGFVRVQERLVSGNWEFLSSRVLQLEVHRDLDQPYDTGGKAFERTSPHPTVLAGTFTLPPFGFRYVRRADLVPALIPKTLKASPGSLESAHFRLTYDVASGRVLQIHDKGRHADLIDAGSEWSFFGYVREMPDPMVHSHDSGEKGREAYYVLDRAKLFRDESCWQTDWAARREQPTRLVEQRAFVSPEGATLLLRWEAPGVDDIVQRITLEAHRPRVTCTAAFNKTDIRAAEAIYFTFPLAMRDWKAHFDTAGVPVEFEHEQLEGSCRDWVTVDNWVSLHDANGAVTLACPDAPLVQIGGFRFGRGNGAADRQKAPLLLAWPMNNYWMCNFRASQPGYVQFRYELTSHAAYDPVESARVGLESKNQIEWHPVSRVPKKKVGRLATVTGKGVVLVGAAQRRRSQSLYLMNVRSAPSAVTVRLSNQTIVSAERLGAAGQRLGKLIVRKGALRATVPPRSLLIAAVTCRKR